MKPIFASIALALSLFFLVSVPVFAAAPTLEPDTLFPATVIPGHAYPVSVTYKQAEGDAPKRNSLKMVIDAPGGIVTYPAPTTDGEPQSGIKGSWVYSPPSSGQYQYHFEAVSSTGAIARYPNQGSNDLEFASVSLTNKYIVLAIGLAVALFFLPFVVYVASRSLNRRGDPSAAARIALMIGILASFALFWYLFLDVYGYIGVAIGAVTALAVLIVLLTRRRAV